MLQRIKKVKKNIAVCCENFRQGCQEWSCESVCEERPEQSQPRSSGGRTLQKRRCLCKGPGAGVCLQGQRTVKETMWLRRRGGKLEIRSEKPWGRMRKGLRGQGRILAYFLHLQRANPLKSDRVSGMTRRPSQLVHSTDLHLASRCLDLHFFGVP